MPFGSAQCSQSSLPSTGNGMNCNSCSFNREMKSLWLMPQVCEAIQCKLDSFQDTSLTELMNVIPNTKYTTFPVKMTIYRTSSFSISLYDSTLCCIVMYSFQAVISTKVIFYPYISITIVQTCTSKMSRVCCHLYCTSVQHE